MDEKDLQALNEARRVDGQEWIVTEAEELLASEGVNSASNSTNKRRFEFPTSAHDDAREQEDDPESYGREERRSPAAVFGSKRIGSVVLPEQLLDSIQRQIDGKPSCPALPSQTDIPRRTRGQKAPPTGIPVATNRQIHLHFLAPHLLLPPIPSRSIRILPGTTQIRRDATLGPRLRRGGLADAVRGRAQRRQGSRSADRDR